MNNTKKRSYDGDTSNGRKAPSLRLPPSIQFVEYVNNEYRVTEAAKAFLLEHVGNEPLAVVTLAGPYRQGKSYLLNRVVLQNQPGKGFSVGQTINACTRGLHLSTKLLSGTNSADGSYHVLVIDTEGFGATDANDTHDTRIFSLGLLLSSLFMFNSKGTIDGTAINQLSLVANISKHVVSKSGDGDLATIMPSFLWVVRDFVLDLVDADGNTVRQDDYLENALKPTEGNNSEVREAIRKYFPNRGCHVMVRPCDSENDIKRLNDLDDSVLRPEFKSQAEDLRRRIAQIARPKNHNGIRLTGSLLIKLATLYCEAINKGAAPAVQDSWALISADECRQAVEKAYDHFEEHIASHSFTFPVKTTILETALSTGFEKSAKLFSESAVGEEVVKYRTILRQRLGKRADEFRKENISRISELAEERCNELEPLVLEASKFDKSKQLANTATTKFLKDMGNDSECRGVWNAAMASRVWDWATRFYADQTTDLAECKANIKHLEKASKEVEALNRKIETLTTQLTTTNAELDSEKSRAKRASEELQTQAEALDVEIKSWQKKYHETQEQVNKLTYEVGEAERAYDKREELINVKTMENEEYKSDIEKLTEKQKALSTQLKDAEKKVLEGQSAIESNAILSKKTEELTKQLDDAASESASRIRELSEKSSQVIDKLRQTSTKAQSAQQQAETKSKTLEKANRDLTAKLSKTEKDVVKYSRQIDDMRDKHKAELEKLRTTLKVELSDARKELSEKSKTFQQQLDENAKQHREEIRLRDAKCREETERLFQENVAATTKVATAEARLARAETKVEELQKTASEERKRQRENNYAGKVADLENQLATATTRNELLNASLSEKATMVGEYQSRVTSLEADLRQITQRHEAQILEIKLQHARES